MLDFNQNNPDFKHVGDTIRTNSYYDIDFNFEKYEIYGTVAIDQAIENLLMTEYGERLFNYEFGTPLSTIFFEKDGDTEMLKEYVYKAIENVVPVHIIRSTANIGESQDDPHVLFITLDYNTNDGLVAGHHFQRRFQC